MLVNDKTSVVQDRNCCGTTDGSITVIPTVFRHCSSSTEVAERPSVRTRTRFRATVVSTKSPKLHLRCQSSRGGLPPPRPPSVPGRSLPQVGCLFQAVEPDASSRPLATSPVARR